MSAERQVTLAQALDELPKPELHCHIEGTMRASTLIELAGRNGRDLPSTDPEVLYRYDSLDDFLSIFWIGQSCLETPDDWERLAYESVVDGAAHGVVYRESFFTPARNLAAGQDLAAIITALEAGLARGEAESGTQVMLIADIDRAFGGETGLEFVRQVAAIRERGDAQRVIGIGMDSTELGVNPADFLPAYRLARDAGFRLTGHQGENSPASDIRYDVEVMGLERIDHGVSILGDPAVADLLARRGIPITVCPISNVLIANAVSRLEDHPWPRMAAAGLHLTLNSDDPAFIQSDLGAEYAALAEAFDYDFDHMVKISLDGFDAAWLSTEERAKYRARVLDSAQDLASRLA